MLLADVNVLVYAHRPESARHAETREWLAGVLAGDEPVGVSELVLSGFLRVVTNHRVYREPTPPDVALDLCDAVLAAPAAIAIRPGARHWSIFAGLCRRVGARANLVPDTFHAALAIENGPPGSPPTVASPGSPGCGGVRCSTAERRSGGEAAAVRTGQAGAPAGTMLALWWKTFSGS